jgi:hypothetical protein
MDKKSPGMYDLRFGILVVIIIMILIFKYFNGQASTAVPVPPGAGASSDHRQSSPRPADTTRGEQPSSR